jgi:3-methyladenine DNA glycosylase/8-oxoguanine DNA glycosylase
MASRAERTQRAREVRSARKSYLKGLTIAALAEELKSESASVHLLESKLWDALLAVPGIGPSTAREACKNAPSAFPMDQVKDVPLPARRLISAYLSRM